MQEHALARTCTKKRKKEKEQLTNAQSIGA